MTHSSVFFSFPAPAARTDRDLEPATLRHGTAAGLHVLLTATASAAVALPKHDSAAPRGSVDHRIRLLPATNRSRLLTVLVGALLMGAALPAHALFGDDEARKAILDLRQRYDTLDREVGSRLGGIERRLSAIETRLDALEQGQRVNLQTQNSIEALREENARLRGQIETLSNDVQQRLGNPASADGKPAASGDDPPPNADDPAAAAYEQALAEFRAGKFRESIRSFHALLKAHPDHAMTPQALFWLGGAQYANGELKAAITTLNQLVSRFPEDSRVPDGYVIIGNSQADGGDNKAARATFKSIIDRFPRTSAAGTARERLKALP